MTDVPAPAPADMYPPAPATQMSPRARRRFYIAFTALIVLLFLGGMLSFALDFRHKTVCGKGVQWVSQSLDAMGETTYVCPNGTTVTQGAVP